MKKRNLFTAVILIVFAGLLMTSLNSCKQENKNIGLQLYSIRDSITLDVPAAIEKVGQMGYTFVEAAGYGNGLFYNMEPTDFKALCEENGLGFLSSHTGMPLPDSANWDKAMEWWDVCIDAHAAAGVKYIVQPFMGGDAYGNLDTLKLYCDYFNTVGGKCNAKGIRFGYHNHDAEFSTELDGQIIYDFMLNNTDPEKVMFQLDLYWCVVGGADPVEYFNAYPGRFELWHIKDKEEVGASGMMDFEAIWATAEVSGMKYGIVEVEEYNHDQFTSCKLSYDYLNEADFVVMPE